MLQDRVILCITKICKVKAVINIAAKINHLWQTPSPINPTHSLRYSRQKPFTNKDQKIALHPLLRSWMAMLRWKRSLWQIEIQFQTQLFRLPLCLINHLSISHSSKRIHFVSVQQWQRLMRQEQRLISAFFPTTSGQPQHEIHIGAISVEQVSRGCGHGRPDVCHC